MKIQIYNCAALTNFDRFGVAVNGERYQQSPCSMGAVPSKQKSVLQRIRLFDGQTAPRLQGLFLWVPHSGRYQAFTTMARKKSVLVASDGKVQLLQSSGLAATTRPGANGLNPLHVVPRKRGELFLP